MRPINADKLRMDSWKTVEDAIFDITHAPTMELSTRKLEKCMHYDTCKGSPATLCGKRWDDYECMKPAPVTNGDHIRSMSDDGLVTIFCYFLISTLRKSGINAVLGDSFQASFAEWLAELHKEGE